MPGPIAYNNDPAMKKKFIAKVRKNKKIPHFREAGLPLWFENLVSAQATLDDPDREWMVEILEAIEPGVSILPKYHDEFCIYRLEKMQEDVGCGHGGIHKILGGCISLLQRSIEGDKPSFGEWETLRVKAKDLYRKPGVFERRKVLPRCVAVVTVIDCRDLAVTGADNVAACLSWTLGKYTAESRMRAHIHRQWILDHVKKLKPKTK